MDTEAKRKADADCRHYSQILSQIEQDVFNWASFKGKIAQEFDKQVRKHQDVASDLPENMQDMMKAQFAFARVFGQPPVLKKFSHAVREDLAPDQRSFLSFYRDHPWRFAFFTVSERLGDDYYYVHDSLSDAQLLLKSESVTRLLRENKHTFFSLVFENPSCFQTYGIVMYYSGITAEDIEYFAKMAHPSLTSSRGTLAAITKDPIPFQLLFAWAEAPLVMHGDTPVRMTASIITVDDPHSVVLPEKYVSGEADEVLKYSLGGETFFDRIEMYLNLVKKEAVLSTQSPQHYSEGVEKLSEYIKFPHAPQYSAGPVIVIAAQELLGKDFPASRYESSFTEETPPESSDVLEKVQAAVQTISERINSGEKVDPATAAREFGIEEETVRGVLELFGDIENRFAIELEHGIPGYNPPPPEVRSRMKGSFEHNRLFTFSEVPRVEELFELNRKELSILLKEDDFEDVKNINELADFIDEAYETYWDREDRTILLYTMHLLRENGAEYHQAVDYAAEVLRIFHQVILTSPEPRAVNHFSRMYSRYLYTYLLPTGIIELEKSCSLNDIRKGTYRLRSTEFFSKWLKWREE